MTIYEQFLNQLKEDVEQDIQAGIFGADMKVSLLNDGPVTLVIDTKNSEYIYMKLFDIKMDIKYFSID